MKREDLIREDAIQEAQAVNEIIATEGGNIDEVLIEHGGDTAQEQAEWLISGDGELDKRSLTADEVEDYLEEFWFRVNIGFSRKIDDELRKLLG